MDINDIGAMRPSDSNFEVARADHIHGSVTTAAKANHTHSGSMAKTNYMDTTNTTHLIEGLKNLKDSLGDIMNPPISVNSRLVQYEEEVFEVYGRAECFTVTRKSTGQGWSVSWSERLGLYTSNYDAVTLTAKLRESIKLACHYLIAKDTRNDDVAAFFGHVNVCRLKRIRRS